MDIDSKRYVTHIWWHHSFDLISDLVRYIIFGEGKDNIMGLGQSGTKNKLKRQFET